MSFERRRSSRVHKEGDIDVNASSAQDKRNKPKFAEVHKNVARKLDIQGRTRNAGKDR